MAEVAAHLVDHVFPEVPVRQWVLSLPHRVRYLLARHPDLCREVRGIFVRAVHSFYSRRARDAGRPGGRCGSIVHVQRFSSDLRLDVHYHALVLDGVYTGFDLRDDSLKFHPASRLTNDEVTSLVGHIAALVTGHLRRRGYLQHDQTLADESAEDLDEEATHHAAAVQGLIPFGPRAGCRTLMFGDEQPTPSSGAKKKLCADAHGYSLHSGDVRRRAVRVGESARQKLEKLARYLARPCLSQDRLSVAKNGHIVYGFRKAWKNGKTAVVLDPMTFLSRLAAQVPPPRFHMLTYHGVLAPAATRREEIVPGSGAETDGEVGRCRSKPSKRGASEGKQRSRPERMPWADVVRRVWLVDILRCECGGFRKVLAMVFDPKSIERVLEHMGLAYSLPKRAPPRATAGSLPFSSS